MSSKSINPKNEQYVLKTLIEAWDDKENIETAANGWPTLEVIREASEFSDSYTDKVLRRLQEQGKAKKAKSRIILRAGEVGTVAPVKRLDEPEVWENE